LAEVRRTIREQSGDYVRLKVFYPTADKGKKSANEIFVIGLELGAVEISVSDTGIGISPEDQAKIFEEFRQVGGDYAHKKDRVLYFNDLVGLLTAGMSSASDLNIAQVLRPALEKRSVRTSVCRRLSYGHRQEKRPGRQQRTAKRSKLPGWCSSRVPPRMIQTQAL